MNCLNSFSESTVPAQQNLDLNVGFVYGQIQAEIKLSAFWWPYRFQQHAFLHTVGKTSFYPTKEEFKNKQTNHPKHFSRIVWAVLVCQKVSAIAHPP